MTQITQAEAIRRKHSMDIIEWWEIEALLTPKDKEAIATAKHQRWEDIDPETAETPLERDEIETIRRDKYHRENN